MAKLWTDEQIHEVVYNQGTYKDGWEFSDVETLLRHVRDEYQAVIAQLVDYAIKVDTELETMRNRFFEYAQVTPRIVVYQKSWEDARAAIIAEFGNFPSLHDVTPK